MDFPVCVDAPPEIRKSIERIRSNASAGVPLHKQLEKIASIVRGYLEWRVILTKQLTHSYGSESKQSGAEENDDLLPALARNRDVEIQDTPEANEENR